MSREPSPVASAPVGAAPVARRRGAAPGARVVPVRRRRGRRSPARGRSRPCPCAPPGRWRRSRRGWRTRGAEDEVDPHALALGEAQLRVVPVGVGARPGGVRAGDVGETGVEDGLEGGPLRGRHMRLASKKAMSQTSSSCGATFQSPTRATGWAGSCATQEPAVGRAAAPATRACSPCAGHRARDRSARRATRRARPAGGTEGPRLRREGVAEVRHPVEPDLRRPRARRARSPPRRSTATGRGRPPRSRERSEPVLGELLVLALGLLQGEHVDVLPLQEGLDTVDAGADGVDVPGSDAHRPSLGRRP